MNVSLETGSCISHYRVISPLGSGGMGEVYMAHDTTLERMVALKILPPELTASEERVRRFVQEAKSASSLSHPHIITIHEIGQAEVRPPEASEQKSDSGPIHYIAMELVDGDTIKGKIHREKTDLKTLLAYLAQAAEGLAKAHAAGIVHRDLKPENIMVTRDGYAKVLDFGLAKLQRRVEGTTEAPTAVRDRTREGVVMGTVGYMSPEQVQGKDADSRSDIFSFGCILYEAATRRKPFAADSDVDSMHKILHDKPEPIDQINPEAPAELRRIIRRCLAKEPEKRYQSMKDLALELSELVEEYDDLSKGSATRSSDSGISTPALAITVPRRRGMMLALAAAALVIVGGLAFAIWQLVSSRKTAAPDSFATMKISRLTSSGHVSIAGISADGRYLAHGILDKGMETLMVRQVATGSDVQIVPPSAAGFRGVTFSSDGNYLYYVQRDAPESPYAVLYQVPSLGGSPRKILFDIDTPVTISPDDKLMAFVRGYPQRSESAVVTINSDGTGERKLAVLKPPNAFPLFQCSWSPDGKVIATIVVSLEGGVHSSVVVVDATTGRIQPAGDKRWFGISGIAWVPDGSGILLTAAEKEEDVGRQQVWLTAYPSGETRRVTNDLNNYGGVSATKDGKTIATIQTVDYSNLWKFDSNRLDTPVQITSGTQDQFAGVVAAPDGTLLFTNMGNGMVDIWSLSPDGKRTALTSGGSRNGNPSISRDGRTVAFVSLRGGGIPHIWRMDPDGSNPRQVTHGTGERLPQLSPDGQWLLYVSIGDNGFYRIPITGGQPTKLAENVQAIADVSPDGKLTAYVRLEPDGSGRLKGIGYVIPVEGGKSLLRFAAEGRPPVHFSPDGKAIDFLKIQDGAWNVWRMPLDGSAAHQLTHLKDALLDSFSWTPDGKTLTVCIADSIRDVVLISDFGGTR